MSEHQKNVKRVQDEAEPILSEPVKKYVLDGFTSKI